MRLAIPLKEFPAALKVNLLATVSPLLGAQMLTLSLFAAGGAQFFVAPVLSNTSAPPVSSAKLNQAAPISSRESRFRSRINGNDITLAWLLKGMLCGDSNVPLPLPNMYSGLA